MNSMWSHIVTGDGANSCLNTPETKQQSMRFVENTKKNEDRQLLLEDLVSAGISDFAGGILRQGRCTHNYTQLL